MATWNPGAPYTIGGSRVTVAESAVTPSPTRPRPASMLRTIQVGFSSVVIPAGLIEAGRIVVELQGVEHQHSSDGQRVQDYRVNGVRYIRNWDIHASAGGALRASVREVVIDYDGESDITIAASASAGETSLALLAIRNGSGRTLSSPAPDDPFTIPTNGDWLAQYFPTLAPAGTPIASQVIGGPDLNINLATGQSPMPGVPAAHSARFSRYQTLTAEGGPFFTSDFSQADQTDIATVDGWTKELNGTGSKAVVDGANDALLLEVVGNGSEDRYAIAIRPAAYADIRWEGFIRLTSAAATSVWLRHSGGIAGDNQGYAFNLFPAQGRAFIGKRYLTGGAGTSTWQELASRSMTLPAGTRLPARFETTGTLLRMWVGSSPSATFPGWAPGADGQLPAGVVIASDSSITGAGTDVLHWNGGVLPVGTHQVRVDTIRLSDIGAEGATYEGRYTTDDGARLLVNNNPVTAYRDGSPSDSWVQQAPTYYTAPFAVESGTGVGPGGEHLEVVEYFNSQFTGTLQYTRAVVGDPPPPPPPSGPTTVLIGAYTGFGTGGIASWENLVQRPQSQPMHYIVTSDLSSLSGIFSWLSGNSTRHYLLSLNTFDNTPGQFTGSALSAELARCQAIAQAINNAGFASRVAIRPMYEFNAAYGFPWQPASHGGQYAAAVNAFRQIASTFKSVSSAFQIVWCIVPWEDDNSDEELVWPGGDVVDIVGLDVYNYWTSGSPTQRWATVGARLWNGINYARSKGKPWSLDEWANFASNAAGGTGAGDDPYYIEQILTVCRTAGDCHSLTFFNSAEGGVLQTLGYIPGTDPPQLYQPNSLAKFREQIALFT